MGTSKIEPACLKRDQLTQFCGSTTQTWSQVLFKAHEAIPNKTFTVYILENNVCKDAVLDMTPQHLIKLAEIKYGMLVQDGLQHAPNKQVKKNHCIECSNQRAA